MKISIVLQISSADVLFLWIWLQRPWVRPSVGTWTGVPDTSTSLEAGLGFCSSWIFLLSRLDSEASWGQRRSCSPFYPRHLAQGPAPSTWQVLWEQCTWARALVCTVLRAWMCAPLPGRYSRTGDNNTCLLGLGRSKGVHATAAPGKAPWKIELVLFATHKSILDCKWGALLRSTWIYSHFLKIIICRISNRLLV